MKNLTKVGLGLFTVILLAGLVFALDYETYKPTGINGIKILTSEPDTTVSEPIRTESDFLYNSILQADICLIVEEKCSVETSNYEDKIAELEERIEDLEANDNSIVNAINNLAGMLRNAGIIANV